MAMTLITTNTSSDAASSDFTTGIDNTYKLYIFKFYDVNPATNGAQFQFQCNVAGQSGFNETMTTTTFRVYQNEAGDSTELAYTDYDQAQGTAYQDLTTTIGSGSDESGAGELYLFNPASTTYVKHFYARDSSMHEGDYAFTHFTAGYFNVTGAIDEISFKMISGNMDAVISMYGVG